MQIILFFLILNGDMFLLNTHSIYASMWKYPQQLSLNMKIPTAFTPQCENTQQLSLNMKIPTAIKPQYENTHSN